MQEVFLFSFLLAAYILSCTEPPPPSLNSKDRDLMDSLFREEVAITETILDSLCNANFDSVVQSAVDSILQVRRKEIERQLQRIRREEVQKLETN